MSELRTSQDSRLESVRNSVSDSIKQLQEDNRKQLEEIRLSVDEKLQKTLNERVSESFKLVGSQLEQVHKSLGEMQSLANGVGDLKKILSNVKTRGIFGEMQLSRILEQILTPEQYVTNFATKAGSRDVVEFAVKLPGKGEYDAPVYLPIDAKFPLDVYNSLLDAYDTSDYIQIDHAAKALESIIKKNAKDIRDKYIDPPNTTDFAIMFLPTESLYAEVVRRPNLLETIARDYSINIAGPTTISALLNSLQMGFRTLAIEKRSHEVWNLLGAIKTEFGNFENALQAVKKRFDSADSELNKLITTRTRAVMRKLKSVEAMPEDEANKVLGFGED
ncbi:MAG: DNA recombination protein RmuC, partial [Oscillospiraceae bacterium]|nr:DNA recombination protein RmuC [Oscillospiraceae bacterium]